MVLCSGEVKLARLRWSGLVWTKELGRPERLRVGLSGWVLPLLRLTDERSKNDIRQMDSV